MRHRLFVLAIFAAKFATDAVLSGPGDGDLAWQRWLGRTIITTGKIPDHLGLESYSAVGAPWVPQEWLFSLAAAVLSGPYAPAFALIVATCAIIAMQICLARAADMGASDRAQVIALVLTGMAMLESSGTRVQVVAWALLALTLYFLEKKGTAAYGAVIVTALWSNVHASVMLAPVIAAVLTVGSFVDTKKSASTIRLSKVTVLMVLATCLNPFGIGLPIYAIHLVVSSPFGNMISEWRRTTIDETSFDFGALPIILTFVALGIRGVTTWKDRLLVIFSTILMLTAARNIAVFAIITMPVLASVLTRENTWFRNEAKISEPIKKGWQTQLLAALVFVLVGGGLWVTRTEPDGTGKPTAAIAAIEALPGERHVLCGDFSWCADLIGVSKKSVYLDGRADPYPKHVWDDYAKIVRGKPTWRAVLRNSGTNVVLSLNASTLEEGLSEDRSWKKVYKDSQYTVWTRQ